MKDDPRQITEYLAQMHGAEWATQFALEGAIETQHAGDNSALSDRPDVKRFLRTKQSRLPERPK
jgi:hypothetical protein